MSSDRKAEVFSLTFVLHRRPSLRFRKRRARQLLYITSTRQRRNLICHSFLPFELSTHTNKGSGHDHILIKGLKLPKWKLYNVCLCLLQTFWRIDILCITLKLDNDPIFFQNFWPISLRLSTVKKVFEKKFSHATAFPTSSTIFGLKQQALQLVEYIFNERSAPEQFFNVALRASLSKGFSSVDHSPNHQNICCYPLNQSCNLRFSFVLSNTWNTNITT